MEVIAKSGDRFVLRMPDDESEHVLREGFDYRGRHYTLLDGHVVDLGNDLLVSVLTEVAEEEGKGE